MGTNDDFLDKSNSRLVSNNYSCGNFPILSHGISSPNANCIFRMAIQLLFVGFYLKYIFALNSLAINFLWIVIMMIAASVSIVRRSELKSRAFIFPVVAGIIGDVVLNGLIYALIVMNYAEFFNARYMIPITGMVIGNCITNAIIGIRAFYKKFEDGKSSLQVFFNCRSYEK